MPLTSPKKLFILKVAIQTAKRAKDTLIVEFVLPSRASRFLPLYQ